ncbi:MAG TPA: cytochrome c biogenesis protein CcsA [Cytophagaceae bacterium]|nr:cytochrome c biogenesis protein CcsA [Cytophagaceae bacterium]
MKNYWWKILCIILLMYSFTAGFLSPVPRLAILNETIRNLYFHVPMWFGMTVLLIISFSYSIAYLSKGTTKKDFIAVESANMGMTYGILGLLTGMLWAKNTWGTYWTTDPKLNAAAVGMLIYLAYFVLRNSLQDEQQRARISAVFNIFAFPTFLALIYVMPRLTDSLHPGNGGNAGFNQYDRDRQMNLIFYSANIGFILLGLWITSLRVRLRKVSEILEEQN